MHAIHVPTRGPCTPRVYYSINTVALHLIAPGEGASVKTRLVEVSREGVEGVDNAQALRAMARGRELFKMLEALYLSTCADDEDGRAAAWWEDQAETAAERGQTSDDVRREYRQRALKLMNEVIG